MKITYYGHACVGVEFNGTHLLFDPFISGNELAGDINIDEIKADFILVSHGHQDHVLDVERIAKQTNATIVANYEVATWFENKGLKTHPMNHGGKWNFDFGTVKYVNAIHSSVLPDGSYGGNPGGFVVWSSKECFYFAGDTALTMDMKLIPMTCPRLDVAILPLGDNFTMGFEEAILASDFIECNLIYGCHFDTFGFIKIDLKQVANAFEESGKNVFLPKIGESITI